MTVKSDIQESNASIYEVLYVEIIALNSSVAATFTC